MARSGDSLSLAPSLAGDTTGSNNCQRLREKQQQENSASAPSSPSLAW
jgi:hypothetical protein